ncbi:hypothetical protein ADIS_1855 [Lunatimonas lonarensis]|uniref:Uncharacterized protein n=1 Tax=Lunatimonas lonarensis TaxID=1232681 RepID=R7ZU13_9BACT|nr:hypothetical protein ADIS_1855 [Lunatimonas lonarensis]
MFCKSRESGKAIPKTEPKIKLINFPNNPHESANYSSKFHPLCSIISPRFQSEKGQES